MRRRPLHEALIVNEVAALARYLKLTPAEQGREVARQFPHVWAAWMENEDDNPDGAANVQKWLEEDLGPIDDAIDETDDAEMARFRESNTVLSTLNSASDPTFLFMDFEKILSNRWMVHFTSDASGIARDGFTRGVADLTALGLTTHFSEREKLGGGYGFAYEVGDEHYAKRGSRRGEQRYGDEAVLFRASGVKVWHHGDEEPQVIFWGGTATDIVVLERGEYRRKSGKSDWDTSEGWYVGPSEHPFFAADDISDVIAWVIANFRQYKHQLLSSTPQARRPAAQGARKDQSEQRRARAAMIEAVTVAQKWKPSAGLTKDSPPEEKRSAFLAILATPADELGRWGYLAHRTMESGLDALNRLYGAATVAQDAALKSTPEAHVERLSVESYDDLRLARGILHTPDGEVRVSQIGKGAFSTVYRRGDDPSRVVIVSADDAYEKEIAASAHEDWDNPHIPAASRLGTLVDGRAVYEMPFYTTPLRKAVAGPKAWADFTAIKKCRETAWQDIAVEHRGEPMHYRGYSVNMATIECAEAAGVDPLLVEALQALADAAANYGSSYTFEFASRNMATDAQGNLVLLDVLYDQEALLQLRRGN